MNESDILRELESAIAAAGNPEGAYTTQELGEALGLGEEAVRRRLKALKRAGRLEVLTVRRENINGVMDHRPAYRILPAA